MSQTPPARVATDSAVPGGGGAADRASPPGPPPPPPNDSPGWGWRIGAIVTLAAALGSALLWIGDTPWVCDEPVLLVNALQLNQNRALASHGLKGSFGVAYGPLPTQIYQLFLLMTHDMVLVAMLRAGLYALVTSLSLLWLSRSLRWTPWLAAGLMLCPFVWLFGRILWDATFVIPIGALAFAGYAAFLRWRSGWGLAAATWAGIALPLVHPQTLPLSLAIAIHLLLRNGLILWRYVPWMLVATALAVGLNWQYLQELRGLAPTLNEQLHAGHPQQHEISTPMAALTPLMEGRLLAGDEFADGLSQLRGTVWGVIKAVSCAIIPLVWLGVATAIAVVISSAFRATSRGRKAGAMPATSSPKPSRWSAASAVPGLDRARVGIALTALLALALQCALYAYLRVPSWQSYLIGPFILGAIFAWMGVEALAAVHARCAAIALFGICGSLTIGTLLKVHRLGWPRDAFCSNLKMSPGLADQQRVARALAEFSDTTAWTDVIAYQQFPRELWALRQIEAPPASANVRESGRLFIRYVPGTQSHIELIELKSDSRPAGATLMELNGPVE